MNVIIESLIYIDDFDIFVFTTCQPQTSIVYVSQTEKQNKQFTNKILAKLVGHKNNSAPCILYVPQSGCLVSAEKSIYKSNAQNNDVQSQSKQKGYKKILIYDLQKQLFDKIDVNFDNQIVPSHVIEEGHQ